MKKVTAFFAFLATCAAGPLKARSPFVVKESHHVPKEWVQREGAPKDKYLNLHIGLKQGNFQELEKTLYEG